PGHEPYEEYFYQSLKHHQREGFLHQKLLEPRSYDYERLRAWEDRLRMPQFRFARTLKGKDESDEEYAARAEKEEADAREAVMTFILGLIAEPVPLQYVYDPPPDRLAQVKGVEVLDRFNCAGCHMVRPGIYQFARKPVLDDVESAYKELLDSTTYQADHHFENHNAWTGLASPQADLLTIHGLPSADKDETLRLRLVQALRFTKKPEDVKDIHDAGELPAGTYDLPAALKDLELAKNQLVYRDDPQGGTFAELLAPYLVARKRDRLNDAGNARAGLPPPLFREGEKTQPGWLFQFLKDPPKIREVTILRMPRFSLSDDDAQALVNYFAAVDQTQNPGIDLTYPYLMVPEHDAGYLQQKSEQYLQRLAQDGAKGRTYTGDAFRTLTSVTLCLNCHRVGNVAKDVNEAPSAPNLALAQERLRPDWLVRWIASPQVMLVYDQGQHPMPQQFPANKIQYPDLFLGLAAKQLPPQLATSLQAAQAKVQEARQAEDKEKDAAKKKDLEAARMKAESALDQIVPNFLKEGEAKVKAAREAEITETDSDKKKELAAARQKVEDEFQLARKEVELYSLNQVAALRDVLMNLNQVAEQSNQRPASPATGGGR
ncbi:MAG: hypothetical protein JO112_00045, partial [Planctomycetes bacterium]|nr:hypothetical protein [Planctomycetota bacterium]